MPFQPTHLIAAVVWLAGCGAGLLHAQELSVQAGSSVAADFKSDSYSWQIDYRQYLCPQTAVSLDWINEGHLPNHSPDGFAIEAWYCLPLTLFGRSLSLSAGIGPYFYFDTVVYPGEPTVDAHGVAPIFSGAVTGYFSPRWFWRATYNRINPPVNDIKVNTFDIGVGYWLGKGRDPDDPDASKPDKDPPPFHPENQVTLYGGWRVSNTRLNRETAAAALEYRRNLWRYVDATVSYIYEGDPQVARRSGIGTQLWAVNRFPQSWGLMVGMGFGAYWYVDRKAAPPGQNPGAAGGLISPMVAERLGSSHWMMRLVWNRVITNYDRDSDVWMLGLGYSWR